MKITTYFCDKCRKETEPGEIVELTGYDSPHEEFRFKVEHWHLCPECFVQVTQFIRGDLTGVRNDTETREEHE